MASAGVWRPLAKLNPCGVLSFAISSLWENSLARGWIMQELFEIVDLGDAMAETRCSMALGPTYDFLYGAGHWTC